MKDRGQDDDAGGLFDALAVDVTVQVQQAGFYSANGRSPAINDPTTAVLAIDRIHHLLAPPRPPPAG